MKPNRNAGLSALAPVTHKDVLQLAGDLDDATVVAILKTGASYVEIEQAVKWLTGDAEDLGKQGRVPSSAASAVYDILMTDPAFNLSRER
jgi:hypothetical protein